MSKKEDPDLLELKTQELQLAEQQLELIKCLPHLYGPKCYSWAREFDDSLDRECFLTAANQIGKSSFMQRKFIKWATTPEYNHLRWPGVVNSRINQFWYLYPTLEVATAEFETKWVPEWMPNGKLKDDPKYGWNVRYKMGYVWRIEWNNGLYTFFKSYKKDVTALQSGSCAVIACDEELPWMLWDELSNRRAGLDGVFWQAFTATIGQDIWRRTMQPEEGEDEEFPQAWKKTVTLYDCQKYEDGSAAPWTEERIQRRIGQCSTKREVEIRIFGKFAKLEGLMYPAFKRAQNFVKPYSIHNWLKIGAIDLGSDGAGNTKREQEARKRGRPVKSKGHPAAIVFLAIRPDFKKACIYKGRRYDGEQTTHADLFDKFLELQGHDELIHRFYDWHSKDFFLIAQQAGVYFEPADKNRETGKKLLNSLFKFQMLDIFDDEEGELVKLVIELENLKEETVKTMALDNFTDALRYSVTKAPWDMTFLAEQSIPQKEIREEKPKTIEDLRKESFNLKEFVGDVEDEIDEWQSYSEID